jgi:hypothetical protein
VLGLNNEILGKDGKIIEKYQPAVYLDSSVLIDYWTVEGLSLPDDELLNEISDLNPNELTKWLNNQRKQGNDYEVETVLECINNPTSLLIRDLFKTDKKFKKMIEIRDKIYYENINVVLVFSPLALNELMKWNAEIMFKQLSSEAIGTKMIQRESEKRIGEHLKKIWEIWKDLSETEKRNQSNDWEKKGVRRIIHDLWIDPSFTFAHGLSGLIAVDIIDFNYTIERAWQDPSAYSYMQLGATDIMHILYAQHLGCKYIASFDSDFKRAKEEIKKTTGIEVLYGHNQILKVL